MRFPAFQECVRKSRFAGRPIY